ncbi:tol-pal system protein YbgF [Undibacter mobilis]|uniref:Cell division coordinator CpoB n=1 Tax=Undibacter mobilis TaxID=2292256 RepID=A0A371BBA2_9BRAD|nr:tol-pal system protein YbgF [Undibacter mobilis]RDV04787.1 tol-pal system protein YbgF [Undibacter mobilis]
MKHTPKSQHAPLTTGTLFRFVLAAVVVALVVLTAFFSAHAQDRNGNFLDNLFSRGEGGRQQQQAAPQPGGEGDPNDLAVRIDRIESALRQLTGTIEQLQYRNQQLEQQVRALQGGGAPPAQAPGVIPNNQNPQVPPGQLPTVRPGVPGALQPSQQPGRRSDVFDPSQSPQAPGAPRPLGSPGSATPPPIVAAEPAADAPIGAPNGRAAGQPLDLSTLSGNQPPAASPVVDAGQMPGQAPGQVASTNPAVGVPAAASSNPPRDVTGRLATLPPSAKPQDEYDLAYGYLLHKDYALAEQAFRDFVKKYPNETQLPDAYYWLGESQYQRQQFREAAQSFLTVSTKHEKSARAPSALLRLGQSLAALKQKDAACATLGEINRKYPKAPANVKKAAEQEITRVKC